MSAPVGSPPEAAAAASGSAGTPMRRPHTALFVSIAVGVAVVGLLAVLATRPSGERTARSRLVGKVAPALEGTSVLDGKPFRLSDQVGKVVVVNFFATWCPPCVQEHPELVALADAGEVEVVSVLFQDNLDDVREFFAKRGGSWPVLNLNSAPVEFGVIAPPESFVVDRSGVIVAKVTGGVTKERLERIIARVGAPGKRG